MERKLRALALFKLALLLIAFGLAGQFAGSAQSRKAPATRAALQLRLGERLFREERFSTSKGDLPANCAHCHLYDEDPQGQRAFTEFLNRSWLSARLQDMRRNELRNSPTLYDVGLMPRLHFDGEFGSLEDLVKGTFAGRPMGWLPGEQEQAFTQIQSVLLGDLAYRAQFRQAFGVELAKLNRDEVVNLVAKAVADLLRTYKSPQNSPYDQFARANGLVWEAPQGDWRVGAERLLAQADALAVGGKLKLTKDFDERARLGMKIFFSVGNCVACHAPPLFTDFSFHNLGISQVEYDQMHGEGKFAALQIPVAATAKRPAAQFRETPTRTRPGEVDLGHWNFVELKGSPLRRAGESDEQFLQRMIGAFKTPTLRHLAYSGPYMHTGSYPTVEDTLREIMRLSELARAGRVREADAELARIRLSESDITPLAAFLNTLNENLKAGR